MNDLLTTEFFVLMNENSQEVSTQEMKNTYGDFIKHVETVSSSNDIANMFRMLNITRIELVSLELHFRYEQGKKCPKI